MVSAVNSAAESGDSAEAGATTPTKLTAFDFDGDGTADLTYYRPSTRTWNGKGDLAIFRPATGQWYLLLSRLKLYDKYSDALIAHQVRQSPAASAIAMRNARIAANRSF